MGNRGGDFQQEQAVSRLDEVHSPAAGFFREGGEIRVGVGREQRQTQSALAGRRPVTLRLVAAETAEQRCDVVDEVDHLRLALRAEAAVARRPPTRPPRNGRWRPPD